VTVAADLILIASTTNDHGDRIAHAMTPLNNYAFVFAHALDAAIQIASTLQPDLVIAALAGIDGVTLCERLRLVPETRTSRLLLLIERAQLNEARTAGANTVVIQPAAAMLVALEAKKTLERLERRTPWVPDRRTVFRGGRRLTDMGVG
jgi:PleD family two-component response regulator